MYDILIRNGKYPDFEKGELVSGDIAIEDGKIKAVLSEGSAAQAEKIIDASGKVVSPGFIDMHMHEELFADGNLEYDVSELLAKQGVTTGIAGNCGISWRPYAEFRDIVEKKGGLPINYALLTGYNNLRENRGIGWYDSCPEDIRQDIIKEVKQDIADGGWGLSFGLEYGPGITTEEMTEAVSAIKDTDPFVSIHFRADCENCMASLEEMAGLSRETGVRVEISHIGSLAAVGGNMKKSLDYVRKEIAENPKLGYDVYPYNAFCTILGSAAFDMDWCAKWNVGYDIIMMLQEPLTGKIIEDEAMYKKYREEYPDAYVVAFALNEDEVRMAIQEPCGLFGSDADVAPDNGLHPRACGTFPRILGKYVREEKLLSLMDALDKMTRRPAVRMGLTGKGEIKEGMDADITVFDPETVLDGAEYTDTSIPNKGIDQVIVAGKIVVDHNELTGALSGKVLNKHDYE